MSQNPIRLKKMLSFDDWLLWLVRLLMHFGVHPDPVHAQELYDEGHTPEEAASIISGRRIKSMQRQTKSKDEKGTGEYRVTQPSYRPPFHRHQANLDDKVWGCVDPTGKRAGPQNVTFNEAFQWVQRMRKDPSGKSMQRQTKSFEQWIAVVGGLLSGAVLSYATNRVGNAFAQILYKQGKTPEQAATIIEQKQEKSMKRQTKSFPEWANMVGVILTSGLVGAGVGAVIDAGSSLYRALFQQGKTPEQAAEIIRQQQGKSKALRKGLEYDSPEGLPRLSKSFPQGRVVQEKGEWWIVEMGDEDDRDGPMVMDGPFKSKEEAERVQRKSLPNTGKKELVLAYQMHPGLVVDGKTVKRVEEDNPDPSKVTVFFSDGSKKVYRFDEAVKISMFDQPNLKGLGMKRKVKSLKVGDKVICWGDEEGEVLQTELDKANSDGSTGAVKVRHRRPGTPRWNVSWVGLDDVKAKSLQRRVKAMGSYRVTKNGVPVYEHTQRENLDDPIWGCLNPDDVPMGPRNVPFEEAYAWVQKMRRTSYRGDMDKGRKSLPRTQTKGLQGFELGDWVYLARRGPAFSVGEVVKIDLDKELLVVNWNNSLQGRVYEDPTSVRLCTEADLKLAGKSLPNARRKSISWGRLAEAGQIVGLRSSDGRFTITGSNEGGYRLEDETGQHGRSLAIRVSLEEAKRIAEQENTKSLPNARIKTVTYNVGTEVLTNLGYGKIISGPDDKGTYRVRLDDGTSNWFPVGQLKVVAAPNFGGKSLQSRKSLQKGDQVTYSPSNTVRNKVYAAKIGQTGTVVAVGGGGSPYRIEFPDGKVLEFLTETSLQRKSLTASDKGYADGSASRPVNLNPFHQRQQAKSWAGYELGFKVGRADTRVLGKSLSKGLSLSERIDQEASRVRERIANKKEQEEVKRRAEEASKFHETVNRRLSGKKKITVRPVGTHEEDMGNIKIRTPSESPAVEEPAKSLRRRVKSNNGEIVEEIAYTYFTDGMMSGGRQENINEIAYSYSISKSEAAKLLDEAEDLVGD